MEKLYEIQKEVEEKCKRNVLLCALQGSQNYNLDDEKSDVDVKVFVMPNFDDFYNCKKISKTYDTKYGKAEVKDIRLLSDLIMKMNPTYLEILATKYFIVNEDFFFVFRNMQNNLQKIIDTRKTLFYKAILGTMRGEIKNLEQSDGSYKTKEFSHILRLYDLIKKMVTKRIPFKEALYNDEEKRKHLLKVKREVLFETKTVILGAKNAYREVELVVNSMCSEKQKYEDETIKKYIQEPIMEYVYDNFKYSF